MKKFILVLTMMLVIVCGATWKVHYQTFQCVRTQIRIEADVDDSIARYREDSIRMEGDYQSLSDATLWETVPIDLAAVIEKIEAVADVMDSSIYVITYDAEESAVSLKRIVKVEDTEEIPAKAKAAGSCLIYLELATQDVAGIITYLQEAHLPVARYVADYYNAELSIYLWSWGGGLGE